VRSDISAKIHPFVVNNLADVSERSIERAALGAGDRDLPLSHPPTTDLTGTVRK
jgi:hypothetical protein